MVSRWRISPIRITSGAWRSVLANASSKEAVSVPTSPLVHDAAFVLVGKLNGVFDGNDMALGIFVTVVDQRSKGG